MSALAQHFSTATVERPVPFTLPIIDGEVQMDEEWIPYVQATLTLPWTAALDDLDPQAEDIWVTITITRSKGRTDRISDLTRRWGSRPLSAITTAFGKIQDFTRSLYHDYDNPGAPRADLRRTFRVMLREIVVNHATARATLRLASGEARLSDWLHMSPTSDRWPGADLAAKINNMLGYAGFTAGLASRPAVVPSDAQIGDEAVRAPGQSAIDWLQQITRKHNLMCWCDEDGLWRLAATRDRTGTRIYRSFGPDRTIVDVTSTRSRDQGWVTAVMLRYTWAGVTSYDIASDWAPNPERARIIDYAAPFPGTGRAARMLALLRKRGTGLSVEAVTDPEISPGETVTVTTRTGTRTGRCAAVQWRLAADEMTIRLREVA